MWVELISPLGALVGLAALPALLELVRAHRRSSDARRAIALAPLARRGAVGAGAAIFSVAGLVALAAAQPVLTTTKLVPVRRDAAAYVVVDTSRSMLAAAAPDRETRLERARRAALAIRSQLQGVKVGVASISDRALPHLLPSLDVSSFDRTILRVLRAGEPAPQGGGLTTSSLVALAAIAQENFFLPSERRRAVVVVTDGESIPFREEDLARAFRAPPGVTLEIVRIGRPEERVFDARGRPEPGYRPQGGAAGLVARAAAAGGGHAFGEDGASAAGRAAARALGPVGTTAVASHVTARTPLAPYALGLAALPLLVLLGSRNVGRGAGRRRAAAATLSAARRRSSVG